MRPQTTDVDSLTESALTFLRTALTGSGTADQPYTERALHVLVDPALSDPLASHPDTKDLPRVPLKINTIPSSQRPYLLCLRNDAAHERAVNTTLRIAMEEYLGMYDSEAGQMRSICAWLISHDKNEKEPVTDTCMLSAAICRFASIRAPFPGIPPTLFRFWDPRITPHLPALLGNASWFQCLQAVQAAAWLTVHADGALKQVGPSDPVPENPARINSWQINAAQWQALERLGWCNRLSILSKQWDLPSIPERSAIDDAVRRAYEHGLTEETDLLRFAHCAFAIHPQFDQHPEVAQALQQWRTQGRPGGGFAVMAQQWTEELMEVLRSGRWLHVSGAFNTPASTTRS